MTAVDTVAGVADRLFAAIEAGDADAVAALWDDDVVVWKSAEPEDQAKKRALRVIFWFMNTTTERRYEILDRQFFDGGFVQQHILHATGRNGGSIEMRVCIVIKVGDRRPDRANRRIFRPERSGAIVVTNLKELLTNAQSVGVWTLVPERSTIGFKAKSMWGLVPVKGTYSDFSGDGQITDPATIFGRIDIKAASLNTKIGKRDNHLRSADFFEVEKYPDISVVITGTDGIGSDTVDLRADLTVKGTTTPVPLKAKITVLDDGAVRITSQADINRQDFGVDGNMMGMIGDNATISGDVVFRRTGS